MFLTREQERKEHLMVYHEYTTENAGGKRHYRLWAA